MGSQKTFIVDRNIRQQLTDYRAEGDARQAAAKSARHQLARPTPQQLAFHDLELGMFVHFGLATYTGQVPGDGRQPPSKFHPAALDCDQWMGAARAMGARYVVLTARHEEGFCLWPTGSTDYSVAHSAWENGRGDVVRQFVDACRRSGLKVGLYHPSWHDRHHHDWTDLEFFRKKGPAALARFTEIQVRQVTELLTNYGEVAYLWFDHHGCPGFGSKDFWKTIDLTVRRLQPECIIFGTDAWINGVHSGIVNESLWYAQDTSDGTIFSRPLNLEHGDPWGAFYRVWEANTVFNSDNWFWDGSEVKPVSFMLERYYKSVGRGANFLPNFAPDPRGLMTDAVLRRAGELGDEIRRRLSRPVAEVSGGGNVVELKFGASAEIDHVVVMEDLREGQRIAAHQIEALRDGQWAVVASGGTVGHKRIHQVEPVRTTHVRFRATEVLLEPAAIRRFAAYNTLKGPR